ncbi:helix-turn-helix domain-containing protein [Streptacidiphilus sp. 4-A2]|nr:helix-turn-helix domain-containing protein [Streptacidiphilus sp. 4-A2]
MFGKTLKRCREAVGVTQVQLAEAVFVNRTSYAKYEAGTEVPPRELAVRCDKELGTGEILTGMWDDADWYPVMGYHPKWFRQLVDLEKQAHSTRVWFPFSVPSLLQTESYMRAQFTTWGHSPSRVDELTAARLSRQGLLFGTNPLQLFAVMDQAALYHHMGDAPLMAEQFEHLVRMSRLRNVTLQVVPFGVPLAALLDSTLDLVTLPDGGTWIYTESLDKGWISNAPNECLQSLGDTITSGVLHYRHPSPAT